MENTPQETKRIAIIPPISFPIIIGCALIVSTLIGAVAFYRVRSFDNAVSVTGSATKEVTADKVRWVSVITRQTRVSMLKTSYAQMDADLAAVNAFLKQKGIQDSQLVVSPVSMDEVYDQNNGVGEKQYTLRQTFIINSDDVPGITNIAKNTNTLIDQGVIFSTQSLEYYYSKLPEERVALLGDALVDAKARAQKLAESTGKSVGTLKSASSGVVQVTSANSLEVSDYGAYDTSQIEKQIMVTVKASFTLK